MPFTRQTSKKRKAEDSVQVNENPYIDQEITHNAEQQPDDEVELFERALSSADDRSNYCN